MLGTLRTGSIAALGQAALVTALLIGVLLAPGRGQTLPTAAIPLAEVVLAVGVALTRYPRLERTARRLRGACWHLDPRQPGRVGDALCTQLALAAIGFTVLTLRLAPPDLLQGSAIPTAAILGRLAGASLASVGLAAFGANAHAAFLARRRLG